MLSYLACRFYGLQFRIFINVFSEPLVHALALVVEGLVENAELIAGNNIHVQSGVISNTTVDNDNHTDGEYTTIINADNDIYLKYCTSVEAHAGGSIYIDNYSLHSALKAQKKVLAGVNNGKGILIGGEAYANDRIEANIFGSEAYVASKVCCAGVTNTKQIINKLTRKKERTENEYKLLSGVLVPHGGLVVFALA